MKNKQMIVCYTKTFNSNIYKSRKEELEYSSSRENVCYYDLDSNEFQNASGENVDITGKRVLPRTYIKELYPTIEAIEANGGIPVNTKDDIERIKNWSKEIYTERRSFTTSGRELLENPEVKKQVIELLSDDGQFFLKTKEKDFSGVVDIVDLFDSDRGLLPALKLHLDDEFIISEKVEILEDELGKFEYRCFVVDGEIVSISRNLSLTYHLVSDQAKESIKKLLERIQKNKNFPTTFTLDVMVCVVPKTDTTVYDIVELNPLEATGEYLYNTIYSDAKTSPEYLQEHNPNLYNSIYSNREVDSKLLSTENQLSKIKMIEEVPRYKVAKQPSFTKKEPKVVYQQAYYKNGFSYHYGCARKFGNPNTKRFYIHTYCGREGGEYSISIEDVLNSNIPLIVLKKERLFDSLKHVGVLFDEQEVDRRIRLEEKWQQESILSSEKQVKMLERKN